MLEIKIATLALWFIIATAIIAPVYARCDDEDRMMCIYLFVVSSLYAIKKVID